MIFVVLKHETSTVLLAFPPAFPAPKPLQQSSLWVNGKTQLYWSVAHFPVAVGCIMLLSSPHPQCRLHAWHPAELGSEVSLTQLTTLVCSFLSSLWELPDQPVCQQQTFNSPLLFACSPSQSAFR